METRSSRSDGFTVIEVVAALSILVIALIGAALLFENGIIVSGNTRNRVVAAQLASQAMEKIRGTAADPTKFTSITAGQTVSNQTVNGVQYTVTQDAQFVAQGSQQSTCDAPGNSSGYILAVNEKVTWTGMAGTNPVQQTTNLAAPVGAYNASSGSIAVKVFDSNGAVAQNINIQISGPTSQTQQTTAEGCAFFAYLPVGTYTVSVIEGTGVGDQEVVAPAQTTSVSVGQTASLQFNYDKPATVAVTGWTGSAAPAASGIPISVANTGLQLYGQYSYVAGTTTLAPLFPYASGYTVFAGNCTDNNPLGKDTNRNPFYPSAATTPLDVNPSQTTPTAVNLYTVSVHVQTTVGVAVSGATMTAPETTSFPVPNSAVCTSGTANGSAPTLGLVTTDASGNSITALPLGHWTIKAHSGTKNGQVNVWVKPDAVYAVDGNGNATAAFGGPITVVVS